MMDALSEALNAVRMTGAIFFTAECTAPWGFSVPHLRRVSQVLAPGTDRLVSYHLVTEGKALVRFADAVLAGEAPDQVDLIFVASAVDAWSREPSSVSLERVLGVSAPQGSKIIYVEESARD